MTYFVVQGHIHTVIWKILIIIFQKIYVIESFIPIFKRNF